MGIVRIWRGAALGAGLLMMLVAGAASADDSACRDECSDARRTCRRAAQAAYRTCRSSCNETVEAAAHAARRACEAGELTPRECARLVHDSVHAAFRACRADCRVARGLARALCREERQDCREACVAGLDPACVETCGEELQGCGEELRTCGGGCRDELEAAVEACKAEAVGKAGAVVEGTCDPEALRACVRDARGELRECLALCHEENPCGPDFRSCLRECPRVDE